MPYRTLAKKEEERFYLSRFSELLDDFPEGEIEDSEEPDFIVNSQPKIGIEVTKLFWEPGPGEMPRQAVASVRELVAIRAQERHVAGGLPGCHVSLHFSNSELRKNEVDQVAGVVFEVVRKNLPKQNEMRRIPPTLWTEEYLPGQLTSILIYRYDNGESFYGAPEGGFIPNLDPIRDIQERVLANKNVKVDAYLENCDEVWLVINIGFGMLAGEFDVPAGVAAHLFQSRFNRTYLLHQHAQRCIRLRTAA